MERLSEAKAHLEEVSANEKPAPVPLCDPRHSTLPERFAEFEWSLADARSELEEARADARTYEAAIAEAPEVTDDDQARLEEEHRAAQARVEEAEACVEGRRAFLEHARERLPEDAEAEAQARIADAEMQVTLCQRAVDSARVDLLPERCRDALSLLAGQATDEWLYHYGPADDGRRQVVRPQILLNIEAQIAATMFRPELRALDVAFNIRGRPEVSGPFGAAVDAPVPSSTDPAERLGELFKHLRFGTAD